MMSHLSTHISSKSRTKSVAKLPEIFECDQCHSKFTLRKNYQRHVKLVYDEAGNPRNLCGMCGNLFCNAKQLKKHYTEAHKGYSCSICDQSFSTKRALENHIKKQSSFKCYECEKTYCSKKILRVHMKYVHSIKVWSKVSEIFSLVLSFLAGPSCLHALHWNKCLLLMAFFSLQIWSCMSIPKHSLLSGEPRDCSIDIQTGKVVQTGVMFLPEIAWIKEMFRN